MLDRFFSDPGAAQRLRCGPLGAFLDSFAAVVAALGYARSTVREQLWLLRDLGHWLERRGVGVTELDEEALNRFLTERRKRGRYRRSEAVVGRFLAHLREQNVVRPAKAGSDDSLVAQLERHFEVYLKQERGLAPVTVANYQPFIHRFLTERFGDEPLHLETVGSSDVTDFVLRHAPSMSAKRAQLMVSALRSFFRFLLQRGKITTDLAACVPTVANWRLATVPKHLSAEEVEHLLDSCDRNTPVGRRDHAILLLLARLGLRAGEVVALELDDIDWRSGEIVVRGKGRIHDRLPLMHDIGKALAAYLRHDRPRCQSRRVFIRTRAPHRPIGRPQTVSTIVRRALQRAGLQPPIKGAHLLRHSLATQMLRRGGTMAEIAEVLRHRTPQTTEIYAKVDIAGLRALAQPWPGDGDGR